MEWNQLAIEDKEEIVSDLVKGAYEGMAPHFPDFGLSDQDIMYFMYHLLWQITRSNDHTYSLIVGLSKRLQEMKAEGKLVG